MQLKKPMLLKLMTKKNKVTHTAQKPIEETYDVVIVGAGGAGGVLLLKQLRMATLFL